LGDFEEGLDLYNLKTLVVDKISKGSRQFDGLKGILARTFFDEIILDGKILVTFQEFGHVHIIPLFYGDTSTGRGSIKDRDKNGKKCFLEKDVMTGKLTILRGFSRYVP